MNPIIDKNHKLFDKVVLKDIMGTPLTMVKSWNFELEIATIFLVARQDSKSSKYIVIRNVTTDAKNPNIIATAKVHLPGCKLYFKDTGKEVTKENL